jgi:hypothetical protein
MYFHAPSAPYPHNAVLSNLAVSGLTVIPRPIRPASAKAYQVAEGGAIYQNVRPSIDQATPTSFPQPIHKDEAGSYTLIIDFHHA